MDDGDEQFRQHASCHRLPFTRLVFPTFLQATPHGMDYITFYNVFPFTAHACNCCVRARLLCRFFYAHTATRFGNMQALQRARASCSGSGTIRATRIHACHCRACHAHARTQAAAAACRCHHLAIHAFYNAARGLSQRHYLLPATCLPSHLPPLVGGSLYYYLPAGIGVNRRTGSCGLALFPPSLTSASLFSISNIIFCPSATSFKYLFFTAVPRWPVGMCFISPPPGFLRKDLMGLVHFSSLLDVLHLWFLLPSAHACLLHSLFD